MRLPLRWLAVGALTGLLAACPPNLKEGRAYRCTPGGNTTQCDPWLCRLDGYCHDPAAGEPLECTSDADCGGGWFCGKDTTCHDPAVAAELPCDTDAQCAGGWRCNAEGRCVDPGAPTGPGGELQRLRLLSPLLPPQRLLSAGPLVISSASRTGASMACASEQHLSVFTIESLSSETRGEATVASLSVPLEGSLTQLAVSFPLLAFAVDGGDGLVIHLVDDGGVEALFASSAPRGFWPLAVALPDDGRHPIAVAERSSGQDVLYVVTADAGVPVWAEKSSPLVDVAGLPVLATNGSSLDIPLAVLTTSTLGTLVPSAPAGLIEVPLAVDTSDLAGTVEPMLLRTSAEGFGIAYRRTDVTTPADENTGLVVSPWDWTSSRFPQVPMDKTLVFTGQLGPACPAGEKLVDFSLTGASIEANQPASVVCRTPDAGLRVYAGPDLAPAAQQLEPGLVDGRAPGVHGFMSQRGHVALGQGPTELGAMVLMAQPDWLGFIGPVLVAGAQNTVYVESDLGLAVASYSEQPRETLAHTVDGPVAATFWSVGYVLEYGADGTPSTSFVASGARVGQNVAGAWLFADATGTQQFVGALGDGVFTGQRVTGVGTLAPTTRPMPGFDLTDMSLSTASDAGAYEAWAVANGRLFRLVGRTLERWSSTEAALGDVEPLSVWFEGARGFMGSTSGQVFTLPERVPVSAPLGDDVSSVIGACGTAFAVRSGELFQLGDAADAGLRAWRPIDPPTVLLAEQDGGLGYAPTARPRLPEAGRLFRSRGRVLLSSVTGMVYELHLTGCPP